MKLNMQKRIIPLLLALALVVPVLLIVAPVTVKADNTEVVHFVQDFSVSSLVSFSSSYGQSSISGLGRLFTSSPSCCMSLWKSIGINDKCIVFACTSSSLFGTYWDAAGTCCVGIFSNPYGSSYFGLMGIYELSSLTLESSYFIKLLDNFSRLYYSEFYALSSGRSSWNAVRWDVTPSYSFVPYITAVGDTGSCNFQTDFCLNDSGGTYTVGGSCYGIDNSDVAWDLVIDSEVGIVPNNYSISVGAEITTPFWLTVDGVYFSESTLSWAYQVFDTEGNMIDVDWISISTNDSTGYLTVGSDAVANYSVGVTASWGSGSVAYSKSTVLYLLESSGGDSDPTTSESDGDSETLGYLEDKLDNLDGKVDEILSGGSAGEDLKDAGDQMGDKNDEFGNTMDDYEDAKDQLPTLPNDVGSVIDTDNLNASMTLLAGILDWDATGLSGMFVPMALVLGIAFMCYVIFGKRG